MNRLAVKVALTAAWVFFVSALVAYLIAGPV